MAQQFDVTIFEPNGTVIQLNDVKHWNIKDGVLFVTVNDTQVALHGSVITTSCPFTITHL